MHLIKRRKDNKYVAKSGSKYSYTYSIKKARKYSTLAEAKADLCSDNEYITTLREEIK